VIEIGDTLAKSTLGLFGVEMTGAWLEANEERIETRAGEKARASERSERALGMMSGECEA